MKRFHVHVAVHDLATSVDFYSKLFGQAPSKERPDHAKWLLDDPRVNFAISQRGHAVGVNHFGFQVDSAEELSGLGRLAQAASAGAVLEDAAASCCYAQSKKHWTIDPQGLARLRRPVCRPQPAQGQLRWRRPATQRRAVAAVGGGVHTTLIDRAPFSVQWIQTT